MSSHEEHESLKLSSRQRDLSYAGGAVVGIPELIGIPYTTDTLNLMSSLSESCHGLEVRDEQLRCLDALYDARLQGRDRALIHMATGLGKTTVIAADVKRYIFENPGTRVLFLCHQNDILQQARTTFEQIIGNDSTFGEFTGESQDYHEVTCLFASFQAMRNWREAFLTDEFQYIVVDEGHHGKAPTYEPTLVYFKPNFMVAMTATPDRHDTKDIREIFGDEIFKLPLEEAIADGLLSPVDYSVVTDDVDRKQLLRLKNSRASVRQIDRTIFIPKRDEEVARIIHEKSDELGEAKRIIFCKSIEQAEEFAQYFENAVPLHSKLPGWEQNKYLQMFRDGGVSTLLAVDMLNEGLDIPDANQIVFLRSTQSKTIFFQQLGRGLRKIPGKEKVQVLDFVANCDRLVLLDKFWKEVANHNSARSGMSVPGNVIRLEIGEVHFTVVARQILDLLSEIDSHTFHYERWTREDSVAHYLRMKDELGRTPKSSDFYSYFSEGKGPTYEVAMRPFDNKLTELQKYLGEEVREFRKYTREEMIEKFIEIFETRNKAPNVAEISKWGGPPASQIQKYFDSYADFRREAMKAWLQKRKM